MFTLDFAEYTKRLLTIPLFFSPSTQQKNPTLNTNLHSKRVRGDLIHERFGVRELERHLFHSILFHMEILKLTTNTHIAVVHNRVEVEEQCNKRT